MLPCRLHRHQGARGGGHVRTSLSHEGFKRKSKARNSFRRAVPQGRAERLSIHRGPPPASVRTYPCPCINLPNLQSLAVLLSAQKKPPEPASSIPTDLRSSVTRHSFLARLQYDLWTALDPTRGTPYNAEIDLGYACARIPKHFLLTLVSICV